MSEVDWLVLNRDKCFEDKLLMSEVAPFPPSVLMANVSERYKESLEQEEIDLMNKLLYVPLKVSRSVFPEAGSRT